MKKEDFKILLQQYINGGCRTAADRMLYFLSPQTVFHRNARTVSDSFRQIHWDSGKLETTVVKTDFYAGENKHVRNLISFLSSSIKDDLAGAYVHGSLGTYEENSYSDFDALVILKDQVVNDRARLAKAAMALNEARKFMYSMDPLQHHGWFVMTESELNDFSEPYFPSELFRYAKSLYPDLGLELNLKVNAKDQDYKEPLKRLCQRIQNKIISGRHPQTMYQLKNLLSEFMLLPALYVQARDRKGMYKKFSFESSRKDFSEEEWRIMDDVSLMRQQWNVEISNWKKNVIGSPRFFSSNLSKQFSPEISNELKRQTDQKFYQSMADLTNRISRKIQ